MSGSGPSDTPPGGHVVRAVRRVGESGSEDALDQLAEEVPVALRFNGVSFAVMMATPCDLEDFAIGFALSEGLIDSIDQLLRVRRHPVLEGIELEIAVTDDAPVARLRTEASRQLPGRSGCGLCGVRDLESTLRQLPVLAAGPAIPHRALRRALAGFAAGQRINAATGAVHAAAWATAEGDIALLREDVGRHNALDKLIGARRRVALNFEDGLLVLSSRASYEMVSKAVRAGIGTLVALSAPTALARDIAERSGLCLIGFARSERFNVYTHAERLLP